MTSHAFLVVPQCPTPLRGRDLLGSLRAMLWLGGPKKPLILTLTKTHQPEEQDSIPSHILQAVWDKEIPGRTINNQPVRISLGQKPPFPTLNLSEIGKGVHQAYILSPCLFNLYTEYII